MIRFHRSMTRPFFTKDRISHFENFDRHADEAIHQIKTRLNEGYAVDIQVRSTSQNSQIFLHPSILIFLSFPCAKGHSHPIHSRFSYRIFIRHGCSFIIHTHALPLQLSTSTRNCKIIFSFRFRHSFCESNFRSSIDFFVKITLWITLASF